MASFWKTQINFHFSTGVKEEKKGRKEKKNTASDKPSKLLESHWSLIYCSLKQSRSYREESYPHLRLFCWPLEDIFCIIPLEECTLASVHSHTLSCHQRKAYWRWINKVLRKTGDMSDLRALQAIKKSHGRVPLFHDVRGSVLKEYTNIFSEVLIFSFYSYVF